MELSCSALSNSPGGKLTPRTATRRVSLAKTSPRSDLGRYVELDPESGLIGISSSSSI